MNDTATVDITKAQTLHEIVAAARQRLPATIWDYVIGGSGTETTILRNRQALDEVAFRPRVLRDVSSVDAGWTLMGKAIRMPVLIAPVGGIDSIWPDGGREAAQGASTFGVPFFLSSVAAVGLEAGAAASSGFKAFQLYPRGDGDWIDGFVKRAIDNGYDAFCFSVDSAVNSRRDRDLIRRFDKPWSGGSEGFNFQASLSWDDIARFKDKHRIPLVLKGIATAEDASRACELGIDAVYVSNHGGRQMDYCLGSLDVLPEIVDAVKGRATIIVDGGFNRGSDIVKAIALGADCVGLGRMYCYGLGAAGAAGLVRMLEILEAEVLECLGQLGLVGFAGLDRSYVTPARSVRPAGVHAAFPFL